MTRTQFLAEPPIVVTINGKEIRIVPRIKPGGLCCYESDPLEIFMPVSGGFPIRVRGTLRLNCTHSKNWSDRP